MEYPDGCHYDTPEEYLWTGVLGGCGCGSSDYFAELSYKLLKEFSLSGADWDKRTLKVYDNEALEIIAHWMDAKGLIEHGTSIGGSWLTEKGKELLDLIDTRKKGLLDAEDN